MFIPVETEAGTYLPIALIFLGSILVVISAAIAKPSREVKPKAGTE